MKSPIAKFHPIGSVRSLVDGLLNMHIPPDFRHNCELVGEHVEIDLGNYRNFDSARIDIGLSHNAPNSAMWSKRFPNTYVLGIEPNRFNAYRVLSFGIWSKSSGERVHRFKPRNFHLLVCAIDNVPSPTIGSFYMIEGDPGTSSLLEPTEELLNKFGYKVQETTSVILIPLTLILEPLLRHFRSVEVIKIDTQGNDLAVLKSAGHLLHHVKNLLVEIDTNGQYKNAPVSSEIDDYLSQLGFSRASHNLIHQVEDVAYENLNFQLFDDSTLR